MILTWQLRLALPLLLLLLFEASHDTYYVTGFVSPSSLSSSNKVIQSFNSYYYHYQHPTTLLFNSNPNNSIRTDSFQQNPIFRSRRNLGSISNRQITNPIHVIRHRRHQQQQQQQQQQLQNLKSTSSLLRPTTTQLFSSNNNHNDYWEGDDIRWQSKLMRRFQRRKYIATLLNQQKFTIILLVINIVVYLYQVISTVTTIKLKYPMYWPNQAITIVWDTITGTAKPGLFIMQYIHHSYLSSIQPYRFITSGFLHGNLLHLVANMYALINIPQWVEAGLGSILFLSTYLASIIGGNIFDTWFHVGPATGSAVLNFSLGASAGICGLYGLMYVCLVRMQNSSAAFRVFKGMVLLLVYGIIFPNINNTGHIGGFVTGLIMGILFGPSYKTDYQMRRKNSLQYDTIISKEYRTLMGYDKKPTRYGLVPMPLLYLVWFGTILYMIVGKKLFTLLPSLIIK